jgi:CDP-diacylglycerol--serine O-phosphatidyltransferase
MRLRRIPKVFVPNTITALSIFTGYLSIIYALDNQFVVAAWLILLAGLLDSMDGRVARRMDATSAFGEEFDSMADVVNYGVSPSLLFYKVFFASFGLVGIGICFLCVFCAAFRLARFNVLSSAGADKSYFTGLPSTIGGGWLASYVIFAHAVWGTGYGPMSLAAMLVVLACGLMISQVPYEKTKVTPALLLDPRRLALLVTVVVTLALLPTVALFLWTSLFILNGLLRSAITTLHDVRAARREVIP